MALSDPVLKTRSEGQAWAWSTRGPIESGKLKPLSRESVPGRPIECRHVKKFVTLSLISVIPWLQPAKFKPRAVPRAFPGAARVLFLSISRGLTCLQLPWTDACGQLSRSVLWRPANAWLRIRCGATRCDSRKRRWIAHHQVPALQNQFWFRW